jgi:hypothetical protein
MSFRNEEGLSARWWRRFVERQHKVLVLGIDGFLSLTQTRINTRRIGSIG